MENLSIELRNMARKAGLCDQWFGEWKDDSDTSTLFDKYKRGIDFCIEHNYPTNDFIKTHWDKKMLQMYNIFVDDKDVTKDGIKGTAIINGDSDIRLNFGLFDTADIYLRHTSKLKVNARYMARIMINLYDDAQVTVNCIEDAKVYIYKHSPNAKINDMGTNKSLVHEEY